MKDPSSTPPGDWIQEVHQEILVLRYKVVERLFAGQSPYQRVEIVDTERFGRMLFNDGVVMLSEFDEHVYHEMIAHVPLFLLPAAERVLVIGGGDGGSVREVIRHPTLRHCRLVEIDRMVVDACREFLPRTAAAIDDPRVEVTIGDGVEFVAGTDERYDLVIVDSTDPVGPAEPLFGPEFYSNVHRVLKPGGVVVSQAESPYFDAEQQRSLVEILAGLFRRTHIYNYANVTYPGGLWSFTYAARDDLCPLGDLDPGRVAASGLNFRYYSPEIHRAAFTLPPFQAAALAPHLTPFKKAE